MGKTENLDRVIECLDSWRSRIHLHNQVGKTDINHTAEIISQKLLNEIYQLNLQNVNLGVAQNYPAIDLADDHAKIAFQITSRKDSKKIKTCLKTFVEHGHNKKYKSLRFLVLNTEKLSSRQKTHQEYRKILSTFNAQEDILDIACLITEIACIQVKDESRFQRICTILEDEFGNIPPTKLIPLLSVRLAQGSKRFYETLTGPTGRFKHLHIKDTLPNHPQARNDNRWLPQQITLKDIPTESATAIEVVPRLWAQMHKHAIIIGEGGMGKTASLIRL